MNSSVEYGENRHENADYTGQAALLLSSQYESTLVEKLTDVLSILSKDDALSIFILAKEGLLSEVATPGKIGLTRKQYYTRLKQLVDLGLLSKVGDSYNHTAFGTVVFQRHVISLAENIRKSKQLEMVDVLRQSSKFDTNDIAGFLSKIVDNQVTDSSFGTGKPTQIAGSFDDMIAKVIETVEFAKQEVLLVSRFTSDMIINSMLKKANTGVSVKVLADNRLVQGFISDAGIPMKAMDKNSKERTDVVANPFYPSRVARKYGKVPFCLLIVDNKYVGMEIVDANDSNKFKMATFSTDPVLAGQMKQMFSTLWSKASDTAPITQTRQIKSR